mgnify:FL=1
MTHPNRRQYYLYNQILVHVKNWIEANGSKFIDCRISVYSPIIVIEYKEWVKNGNKRKMELQLWDYDINYIAQTMSLPNANHRTSGIKPVSKKEITYKELFLKNYAEYKTLIRQQKEIAA